ncbi:MAG: hydroxyethylthiazole kinase [Butyrivibrio sp.]|uniref:hydroxyethylthiazole kinase n=1 Tax=Butyrivibrio sp. TaxID=28121 RepID=UPI001B1EC922|nr:hydroxyethylthiazole kinase [Butyrivibrio sp.]MBO6241798.1 hydroxyethylthiazole kinase [Butyrivibrio sp.]
MANLIHCITNPISMMQCANAVLALGDKPIMAEHPLEVKEITNDSSALLLNLGNISDSRMESMKISLQAALSKKIPIVLDAVGVACSRLRRDFVGELLKIRKESVGDIGNFESFMVVKGNNAEIKALFDDTYKGKGVDADEEIKIKDIAQICEKLAANLNVTVLCSGEKDIVTDGKETFLVSNGVEQMGNITGTGCMLGAICASFLSKKQDIGQVVRACGFFGIAGEYAYKSYPENENIGYKEAIAETTGLREKKIGSGSFLIKLLDAISLLSGDYVDRQIKSEKISF